MEKGWHVLPPSAPVKLPNFLLAVSPRINANVSSAAYVLQPMERKKMTENVKIGEPVPQLAFTSG